LNITRPLFYHGAWEILSIFDDPPTALQLLWELEVSEGGELDPTRIGPVCFPWVVSPHTWGWDLPLENALTTFKNQV